MAITVKFRRGSTSQSNSFLGDEGELYIDKDKDTVVVHDGTTVGGFPLASEAYVTQAIANFGTSSFSGSYNDLTDTPTLFSGAYGDLTGLPTLFSGAYNDLSNLPNLVKAAVPWSPNHTLADGTRYLINDVVYDNGNIYVANYDNESLPTSNTTYWTNLGPGNRLNIDGRDIPNISYNQLTNLPTLFSGAYDDLTGLPLLFSGSYNDLSDTPVLFSGSYTDLLNKPTLFSGSYNDLTDKPTIPSLTGYATETYVNTQVANLVDTAPATLNTLNELAAALGDDPNFATTISNQIGLKANTSSLATVATSGSYNDLTNKPTLVSSFTNDANYANQTYVNTQVSNLSTVYQPLNANLTTLSTNGYGVVANRIPRYDTDGWLPIGANWKVRETGGVLFFAHGTTNRMKIDASGNLTVAGDITAFGTV